MNKLKILRKNQGFSQNEVAKYLGINQVSYSQYELNKTEPNISSLIKLSKLYNSTVDELLGIENEQQKLSRIQEEILVLVQDLDERTLERIKAFILGITNRNLELEIDYKKYTN